MSSGDRSRRARRWMLAGLAALVVAVVAWLLSSRPPADAKLQPAAKATPASSTPELDLTSGLAPKPPNAPPASKPAAAPIVDEVLVEKKEVCSGEDNLITVRAHTPDGTDAYLHYVVGTGTGAQVPLRVWLQPDGTYQLPRVTVFGRNNVSTTVTVPPYKVKDCQPERIVEVFSRLMPNAPDEYEFMAKVMERPLPEGQRASPFTPVRYVWTFDEGEQQTTTTPLTSHSFSGTPHDRQYMQHLIQVDVFDAAGHKATGRSSLQLLSTAFENFAQRGIVTIFAAGTPRFPVLADDGVVRQTFHLFHHYKGTVRIQKVTAIRSFVATDGPPPPDQADPATLPVESVPEGKGADVQVQLDTRAEQGVTAITYSLEGVSEDGHPAKGTFSVMKPPPRPTKESNIPVTDPVLLAKIKKARELLKQEYVTDEDIWRLDREGRFADLKADAGTPGR